METDAFSLTRWESVCRPTPSRLAPSETDKASGFRQSFSHDGARMHGVFSLPCQDLLMVIQIVDIHCVSVFEPKRHPPVG